ncbi:MAG: hypothetical protein LBT39_05135, partial [Treponema sp.]|nr:hypothetical protein [Treponema sp.]
MDLKTIIKENLIQLISVFAVFLFMIIFGSTWAASNVRQYMAYNAEETLMVSEERIQAKLRESEV